MDVFRDLAMTPSTEDLEFLDSLDKKAEEYAKEQAQTQPEPIEKYDERRGE